MEDSDNDESEALVLARSQNGLAALPSCSLAGGSRTTISGSRTTTSGSAPPPPVTADAAKAAQKAEKKKPSTKLVQLLEASQEPLAVFLRETYDVTGNFSADGVELEVMQRQFRRWQRAAQQDQAAAAVPLLVPATAAVAGSAGLLGPAVTPKITGEDVAALGFTYQNAPEHDMFGLVVNPQDFSDDPREANRLVYMAAELVAVLLHTIFIWGLPAPFFVVVFGE